MQKDYRGVFHRLVEIQGRRQGQKKLLYAAYIETPIAPMVGISDEKTLYFLEFIDKEGIERSVEKLKEKSKATLVVDEALPLRSIQKELDQYFEGTLKQFKTPLFFLGTRFQGRVWEELQKIPFGETRSYADIAVSLKKPTAYRAVARANATNRLVLIIPCHRVINANGAIGGYGGGIGRKEALLSHEKSCLKS